MSREAGPIVANGDGTFSLHLDQSTRTTLDGFFDQLASLAGERPDDDRLRRLHPDAYHLDPDKDSEWKDFMRPELAASRAASIAVARRILADPGPVSEADLHAFMRVMNSLRLVLGTLLEIEDDEEDGGYDTESLDDGDDHDDHDDHAAAQWALYEFSGWLLEWTVRALSGETD